jgi:arsenite-transporting ATPase
MEQFILQELSLSKYLFFTGKGGVGKTSIACAAALSLADSGKKTLLICTDPASNLQDVFNTELDGKGVPIKDAPNLVVANLDPIQAAAEYRENIVAQYRGKLPDTVITNMEEQLSGSCTIEIAAFNEFSNFITDKKAQDKYAHIIFDTAPTGHTLRMLQLPSAWSDFISENTHGASCLGQLSGLEERKDIYKKAVLTLADGAMTILILVSRPESAPLKEAQRAAKELAELGIKNQSLIINGVLETWDDTISKNLYDKQQRALSNMPSGLQELKTFYVPLRAYNITGLSNVRSLLKTERYSISGDKPLTENMPGMKNIINDLCRSNKKVIFTMGKGGVGKTTIAAAVAMGLSAKGKKVHLSTTDPAAHLKFVIEENSCLTMSRIDEQKELKKYQEEILSVARKTMSKNDIAYIEEDLRSPCTQEIAVFRRFAQIVEKADNEIVVIDTAPTGHTLLLLDSTLSYHREVQRTQGIIPDSVKKLLPRLRNADETEVLIITLAETTPVYEAMRLEQDLHRAGIATKWWIINASFFQTGTTNQLLSAKASHEIEWINKVDEHTGGNFAVTAWYADEIRGEKLLEM